MPSLRGSRLGREAPQACPRMSHSCPLRSLLSSQLSIRVLLLRPAGHQCHHHLPQRSPLHSPAHGEEVSPASSLISLGLLPQALGICWALARQDSETGHCGQTA